MSEPRETFVWRGLTFTRCNFGVDWRTEDDVWKVSNYSEHTDPTWYARLRIGCHRFNGQANTREEALDEAKLAASGVEHTLRAALKKVR